MKARIEFEVESEEEFNRLKDVSECPGETWTLIKEDGYKKSKDALRRLRKRLM